MDLAGSVTLKGAIMISPEDLAMIEAFMNLPPWMKMSIYVVIVYVISLLIIPTETSRKE